MGTDKGLIKIDGKITVVDRIIGRLKDIFDELIIVSNSPASYKKCDAKVVEDLIKNKGPLGGILTGLCYSTSEHNFVVGCDMPFIHPELIRYIIDKPDHYDAVIPEIKGRVESLFARYSKKTIPAILDQLMKDELRIQNVLKKLNVLKISLKEIERFDPEHLSFININTREDLKALKSMAR